VSRGAARALGLVVAGLLARSAAAQGTPLRGHVKLQEQYFAAAPESLEAALGYRKAQATSLDLRLIGTAATGGFRFDGSYLLYAEAGSAVTARKRIQALTPDLYVDRAASAWLPLDDTLTDGDRKRAVQSLDRFSMSYTTESWVFTLGRQAYSWGNGIVFRPMDLFDPFAPDAVDESYKPGVDAIYVQRLAAGGSDLTALIVPRRNPVTGRLEKDQSSAALKWHAFGSRVQVDVLAARDYRDTVFGLGLAGAWGGAVWRLDLVPVRLEAGGTEVSLVANLEHAWQWRGRNLSGFVEYFRNGFGRGGRGYTLEDLGGDLIARLARGQLFDTGRDYAAGGLRIELTPLLEIDPVLLVNLGDRSSLLLVRGSYSIRENLSVDFGVRTAGGRRGTEFGGLRTSTSSAVYEAPPSRIFARLARYF
jgi:hypothetical protein